MTTQTNRPRPTALIVLDGWGYSEIPEGNAIHHAHTPHWDQLWKDYPHALIQGSGNYVGLPAEQMGNSEVGHLNMGAGRVVHQEITRIDHAIEQGEFQASPVLSTVLEKAAASGKAVHVMGLLSDGGVHSRQAHIHAMVRLAIERVGGDRVYVHAFLDGRDTPPKSAAANIEALEKVFREAKGGRLVSIVGRYFAMDRDRRWERTRAAYELICRGTGEFSAASGRGGA